MINTERVRPQKLPEKSTEPAGKPGKPEEKRADLPDFDSLLSASSTAHSEEIAKEKAAAGGDLKLGESKSDADFRQMLEKVTGKKQEKLKNKLEKDDYLNLMVTQLKYQDPTKPMENQEMATQLAQFNTVEQLMSVNKTLGELKQQNNSGQMEKLTPFLGKEVEVAGDKILLRQNKSTSDAIFTLPSPVGTASVQVKDQQGTVVRNIPMGSLQAGQHVVSFDGKNDQGADLPAGSYTFSVAAAATDGKAVPASQSMSISVDGITDLANGGKLSTALGNIEAKDIVGVRAQKDKQSIAAPLNVKPPIKEQGPSPLEMEKIKASIASSLPGGASNTPGAPNTPGVKKENRSTPERNAIQAEKRGANHAAAS